VTLKREANSDDEVLYQTIPEDKDGKFLELFSKYLQIDGKDRINVQKLYAEWSAKDKHFKEIAKHIEGVRCVRQDPWECTISFICSQNNNIKRITSLLQTIRSNVSFQILSLLVWFSDLRDPP
jgi:N-glycosylase/DNA lyase